MLLQQMGGSTVRKVVHDHQITYIELYDNNHICMDGLVWNHKLPYWYIGINFLGFSPLFVWQLKVFRVKHPTGNH